MSHCDKCVECREGGCETCCYCMADLSLARVPTSREEAFLAAVMAGLPRAREKHPTCGLVGVSGEYAEVVHAVVKREGQERTWLECVDLAITACRLAIEGDEGGEKDSK